MGKEVKIGVAVISVLLVILAAVVVKRLAGGGETPVAEQPAELSDEPTTPLALVDPATQPTLLATSPSDAQPPLAQMSPPAEETSRKWRNSRQEATADEIEPGTSFMPKADHATSRSKGKQRVAARPRTFTGRNDRYAAAEVVAEEAADATVEVVGGTAPDASKLVTDTATDGQPSDTSTVDASAVDASAAQDESASAAATSPAVSEVSLRESPSSDYRRSRRHGYQGHGRQASSSDTDAAPAPPAYGESSPADDRASTLSNEPPAAEAPYRASPYRTAPSMSAPNMTTPEDQSASRSTPIRGYHGSGHSSAPVVAEPTPSYQPVETPSYAAQPVSQPVEAIVETRENTGKYYVEPGDSFWTISQKMYGTGGYFKALQEHNRTRFPQPNSLNIGDEVLTPSVEELREKYSGLCPKPREMKPGTPQIQQVSASIIPSGRTYVVEEGDTLYDIAKYELGDGQRWPEIFQLNRHLLSPDIDYLRPGITLNLPASKQERVDVLTRQPGRNRRR